MTIRRRIINALDRPGSRKLLAWIATRQFRALSSRDVEIFYDGSWFSRDGKSYLSDSVRFEYNRENLISRPDRIAEMERNCSDFWFHLYKPQPGDVIVDVGAGTGHETALFSRAAGAMGKVVAVEAHPKTFERMTKSCRHNGCDNVVAKNYAIVDQAKTVSIQDTANDEANAVSAAPASGSITVQGVTLDALLNEVGLDHVNFLKMNIEGAEQWAIEGMAQTIQKTDYVAIACHDFLADENPAAEAQYRTREKVRSFLVENGFVVADRADDPRPYVQDHLHAWREEAKSRTA